MSNSKLLGKRFPSVKMVASYAVKAVPNGGGYNCQCPIKGPCECGPRVLAFPSPYGPEQWIDAPKGEHPKIRRQDPRRHGHFMERSYSLLGAPTHVHRGLFDKVWAQAVFRAGSPVNRPENRPMLRGLPGFEAARKKFAQTRSTK